MTPAPATAHDKIIRAGVDLFRTTGFVGTSVDDICRQAGITKGAFFHHFESKESLAKTCLQQWNTQADVMDRQAPYQSIADPVQKLLACMDFYIALFSNPQIRLSCLAGTAAQEVAETHPTLRAATDTCFKNVAARFGSLVEAAGRARRKKLDTAGLAKLWMATIQGSLLLCKADGDTAAVGHSLTHVKDYIAGLLDVRPARAKRASPPAKTRKRVSR